MFPGVPSKGQEVGEDIMAKVLKIIKKFLSIAAKHMYMKVITTRVKERYLKDLEKIEEEEQADRAEVVRRLLAKAIKDWKIKKALELLKDHKVTVRKAAEIAGVTYAEMLELASEAEINIGYTESELKKDLKRI